MSLSSSFELLSFQRKVDDALRSVERTLALERRPRLAADVDHTYGAKYGLVDLVSNAAVIAYMNCFDKLGLDAAVLNSIDATKPATLRFDSSTAWKFRKEVVVDVPVSTTCKETEETSHSDAAMNTKTTKVIKAVRHIKEYHWDVDINWSISVYSGTDVGDKKVVKSHAYSTTQITQTKEGQGSGQMFPAIELSLTWFLRQIDVAGLTSQFKVDTEDAGTKTPRRNGAVEKALEFAARVETWIRGIRGEFLEHLHQMLQEHNPASEDPSSVPMHTVRHLMESNEGHAIFNPILPLMDDTSGQDNDSDGNECTSIIRLRSSNENIDEHKSLLSSKDISKLLNEHVRTLEGAIGKLEEFWASETVGGAVSSSEATLSLLCVALGDLSARYEESMSYVEQLMERQLIAAIGKRITPGDLNKFVKYHDAKLLRPRPQPFSRAIRLPDRYPVGLLSIESDDGEQDCIHSHSREVVAAASLKVPLNAATAVEFTGKQYLHGYLNHRFGTSHKTHRLIARARQFSSFILVIGNMRDASTLDPKDAIIVQNKDELLIPLLLDELPTAKEFKDAIKSLSPEQQRFAGAYRKMQLASSVFGICVVQIKPQLEALLGLPPAALDKEMKLTQDLMELFVEYQVPSDLLSCNSFADAAIEDKISNVKNNVKGVLDVVDAEKKKQLELEQNKAEMAKQQHLQEEYAADQVVACDVVRATSRSRKKKGPSPTYYSKSIASRGIMRGGLHAASPAPAPPPAPPAPSQERFRSFSTSVESCCVSQNVTYNAKREVIEIQDQRPTQDEENRTETLHVRGSQSNMSPVQGVDFTLVPQTLDAVVEQCGGGNALRSTTIKTGNSWTRNRQENLLTAPKRQSLNAVEVKKERNKAFDLLDALCRSGSLPIAYNELHVVVAVTHCFDKDVMSTVVCDNVNPIEKLECSTLLLASTVHGVPARELVADAHDAHRLEESLPLLLGPS